MTDKSIAELIRELDSLRASGSLTDEEFAIAKQKLLSRLGSSSPQDIHLSKNIAKAASSVSNTFSGALSETEASYKNLLWILYWGTVGVNLISLFPPFFWLSIIIGLGLIIIAAIKIAPSRGTIYNSHFKNIVIIAVVSLVAYLILLIITIGTLGLGLVITIPLGIALIVWYAYRVIKGMMRLNEGRSMSSKEPSRSSSSAAHQSIDTAPKDQDRSSVRQAATQNVCKACGSPMMKMMTYCPSCGASR